MANLIVGSFTHYCPKCGHDTEWAIEHSFEDNEFSGGASPVEHLLICQDCNVKVTELAWSRFQSTGKVIIPV